MQHGVQQPPQQQQQQQRQQPVGQQIIRHQQDFPSQAYTLAGHLVPQLQQSHHVISSGGQNYGQPANYQIGGLQQSYQDVGHSPVAPRPSNGLWTQSRAEQVAATPQPTSPWDPQSTSTAFGAAFESFLNKGSVEEVQQMPPISPFPPPAHRAIPVQTRRKSLPRGNSNQQVPAAVEPSKVQKLVEKVAKEVPRPGRRPASTAHPQMQVPQHQNTAPFIPAPDFSSFFSPVKATRDNAAAQEETLSESCEMTKRVSNFLKKVEQQHPAPGVWPSLPGALEVQGPKVVQVKKGNLELVKSETLFVPQPEPADILSPCNLCGKVFASQARLAAHQVAHLNF